MGTFSFLIFALGAYLLGSVLCSILLAHFFNCADPRASGSKNPGATNMLRVSSKKMALLTFLGDTLKGVLVIVMARLFGVDAFATIVLGLMVFLGHLFPLYFGFKGGKGVATGLGVVMSFSPMLGVSMLTIWFLTYLPSQYVSLASMLSFAFLPIAALFFYSIKVCLVLAFMSIMLLFSHKENIQQLIDGSESKTKLFGFQKEK